MHNFFFKLKNENSKVDILTKTDYTYDILDRLLRYLLNF